MLVLFAIALMKRDYSVADRGWGTGILLAALAVILLRPEINLRQFIATLLVAIWALRLGAHIILRNWGKGEDRRYAHWRTKWGDYGWFVAFFSIFVQQGVLMLVVASPLIFINYYGGGLLNWFDLVALAVWTSGFIWEIVADHQLMRFKADPANAGRVLSSGLWKYSRHPNYFGEIIMWWGLWLFALSVPLGWLTVISPLLVMFLLLKVSGVPLLESAQMQNSEYRHYARQTAQLWPRLRR
jgi:steroid 5-alpha reductase family enzyme